MKKAYTAICVALCILLIVFVFIAIVRSEYAEGQNKRSKGRIFGKVTVS